MTVGSKEQQALDLRRAGMSITEIRQQLGYRTNDTCEKAITRAMQAQGLTTDPLTVRMQELDRINTLQAGIWDKAASGDIDAIDRVLKLTEMRLRIAGVNQTGLTPMVTAYDQTIDALPDTMKQDTALIAMGRRYCEQIDAATAFSDPTTTTKALYLMPNILNILKELGATPAARQALQATAPKPEQENRLAKFKATHPPLKIVGDT